MNEYYCVDNTSVHQKFFTKDEFEGMEESYCCDDCEAGGLIQPGKQCPREINKNTLEQCPLFCGDRPCKDAYEKGLVCKIHGFRRTKSYYTGKAVKQLKVI